MSRIPLAHRAGTTKGSAGCERTRRYVEFPKSRHHAARSRRISSVVRAVGEYTTTGRSSGRSSTSRRSRSVLERMIASPRGEQLSMRGPVNPIARAVVCAKNSDGERSASQRSRFAGRGRRTRGESRGQSGASAPTRLSAMPCQVCRYFVRRLLRMLGSMPKSSIQYPALAICQAPRIVLGSTCVSQSRPATAACEPSQRTRALGSSAWRYSAIDRGCPVN